MEGGEGGTEPLSSWSLKKSGSFQRYAVVGNEGEESWQSWSAIMMMSLATGLCDVCCNKLFVWKQPGSGFPMYEGATNTTQCGRKRRIRLKGRSWFALVVNGTSYLVCQFSFSCCETLK